MVLLQAAMMAGFVVILGYAILLIIGTPILIGFIMKGYWRLTKRALDFGKQTPYYKEPIPFLISIVISVGIITGLCYCLFLLLFKDVVFQ